MNEEQIIKAIAEKDVDIDKFVKLVISDETIKSIVLTNLLKNKDIMVYYHCYYIVSKASEEKPALFYDYWNEFVLLLDHKNSYHRDIGLTMIANLTKVDSEGKFSLIYHKYIEHFNDAKFMTSECFVKNLTKIIINKPEYEERLIELLTAIDEKCKYPLKQREVLKSFVIKLFDTIYENSDYKNKMILFVENQSQSMSPKTRKMAKVFLKKHK